MSPLRDEHGSLAPELDLRWVPLSTMAEYVGVSAETLWRWRVAGQVPENCTRAFGRRVRWMPAAYFAEQRRLAGFAP